MPKYIALTLGPIGKTISQQRRTRAVFAASYLFSYTMKKIMEKLLENGSSISAKQILAPSTKNIGLINPGCGLFGDRLILESENVDSDFERLLIARDRVLEHISDKIEDADESNFPKGKILPYLKKYMQIYCLHITLEKGKKTIEQINQTLDQLELFPNLPADTLPNELHDEDFLISFFNQTRGHFILEDAFGDAQQPFSSLEEIATKGLSKLHGYPDIDKKLYGKSSDELKKSEARNIFEIIKESEIKDELKAYHKYVAIVHADADSMGNFTEQLSENSFDDYIRLSEQLSEFGLEVKNAIQNYGGSPVYIGGDDLLFFAPVASYYGNKKKDGIDQLETIFDLISDIDKLFEAHISNQFNIEQTPSVSYGVSISYYKYPLNEALKISADLLKDVAKKQPNKNSIGVKLLKHSGHSIDTVISKNTNSGQLYKAFNDLLDFTNFEEEFINSLTHRMGFFHSLFYDLIITQKDTKAVQSLFDNNFNEAIHSSHEEFIKKVVQLVIQAYQYVDGTHKAKPSTFSDQGESNNTRQQQEKAALSIIYSTLRFIHFIRSKADNI